MFCIKNHFQVLHLICNCHMGLRHFSSLYGLHPFSSLEFIYRAMNRFQTDVVGFAAILYCSRILSELGNCSKFIRGCRDYLFAPTVIGCKEQVKCNFFLFMCGFFGSAKCEPASKNCPHQKVFPLIIRIDVSYAMRFLWKYESYGLSILKCYLIISMESMRLIHWSFIRVSAYGNISPFRN